MKKLLVFISLGMLLFACSGDNNMDDFKTKPTAETKISPGEILNIAFAGATHTIAIETTGDWKIGNIPDWCSFNQTSGKGNASVKLTATPNNATSTREAVVKINNQTLTLKQIAKPTEPKLKNADKVGNIDVSYSGNFEVQLIRKSQNREYITKYKIDNKNTGTLTYYDYEDKYQLYAPTGICEYYESNDETLFKSLNLRFVYPFSTKNGVFFRDIRTNMPNLENMLIDNKGENFTGNVFSAHKIDENTYIYTFTNYTVTISDVVKYIVNGKMQIKIY